VRHLAGELQRGLHAPLGEGLICAFDLRRLRYRCRAIGLNPEPADRLLEDDAGSSGTLAR